MTEEDSLLEESEETARLASRRLSVTLRCYEALMAYYARVNSALVASGGAVRPDHLDLVGQAVEDADKLLEALNGNPGQDHG